MKLLALAFFALAQFFVSNVSYAQSGEEIKEFLFCDNCSTPAEFELVARQRATKAGQAGEFMYAVGNRLTGTVRYVFVTYNPAGHHQLRVTEGPVFPSGPGGVSVVQVPVYSPAVVAPMLGKESMPTAKRFAQPYGQPFVSSGSSAATPDENAGFTAVIRASENRIVLNAPDQYGFDSLTAYDPGALGSFLSVQMSSQFPGWQGGTITRAISGLYKAVGWEHGKGPTACIVFRNGDFGCFYLNVLNPGAPTYIMGTGKDANGQPMNTTPSLPNGNDLETNVYRNGSYNSYGLSGRGHTEYYLVCRFVGGILDSCYVQPVHIP